MVLTIENDVLSRAVNMLLADRIDVLVKSDLVFWYRVNQMRLSKQMKYVGQASQPMEAYIAYSPHNKNTIDYAQIFSDSIPGVGLICVNYEIVNQHDLTVMTLESNAFFRYINT